MTCGKRCPRLRVTTLPLVALLLWLALGALAGCALKVPKAPFGEPSVTASTSATPLWLSNDKRTH